MNNATILVVDDEPQIRRVLRSTLSSNGYDVIEAKNGQEAIEMAVREHPDLILLDVNMPEMSGLDACSKMRLSFSTPIIMVTVRNSEQDKVLALDSGADDYVVKPFAIGRTAGAHSSCTETLQLWSRSPKLRLQNCASISRKESWTCAARESI